MPMVGVVNQLRLLHRQLNRRQKVTSISVICSTCFLSCAISISILYSKVIGSYYFTHSGRKSQGPRCVPGQMAHKIPYFPHTTAKREVAELACGNLGAGRGDSDGRGGRVGRAGGGGARRAAPGGAGRRAAGAADGVTGGTGLGGARPSRAGRCCLPGAWGPAGRSHSTPARP